MPRGANNHGSMEERCSRCTAGPARLHLCRINASGQALINLPTCTPHPGTTPSTPLATRIGGVQIGTVFALYHTSFTPPPVSTNTPLARPSSTYLPVHSHPGTANARTQHVRKRCALAFRVKPIRFYTNLYLSTLPNLAEVWDGLDAYLGTDPRL